LDLTPNEEPLALQYGANGVTIDAALQRPGYLVLADTYYPSWKAFVDGQPWPVLRANYAFRAVALPAGYHRVIFRYEPVSFRLGLSLSGATWLSALPAWLWLRRKNK
jgi:uncharacterized membrane protein YfhO